jgi:hypothetical protein
MTSLEEFLERADQYLAENKLGLDIIINDKVVEGVNQVLNFSPSELYSINQDDKNKFSLLISQYCLYLRNALTKLENTIDYCNFFINEQVVKVYKDPEYDYMPKDLKPHSMARTNSFIEKLLKIRVETEAKTKGLREKIDLLKNIAYRITL